MHVVKETALRTLHLGILGLEAIRQSLDHGLGDAFTKAVEAIKTCKGRVIVTGMGKSGHVGQKIAATLASTGTPAQFVHPAEASHGDLGMITARDIVLALSWSGETPELANLITYSRRFDVPLVAMTSMAASALALAADITLVLPRVKEACPHGLAPTTSTLTQLAFGDCIAMALLESRGFSADDFKMFHPGGKLGARLQHVSDLMHKGNDVPLAPLDMRMDAALLLMTEKSFGCLGIVNERGHLAGVITDGDLRRNMMPGLLSRRADEIMTRAPKTVLPETLASTALQMVSAANITALFVVENGVPTGIVHIHDLLRAGVV